MAQIKAFNRENTGKGVARELRRNNQVPGVVYGLGKEPTGVAVDGHSLLMATQAGSFYTTKHELDVDGKKIDALARDLQRHPVTGKILHIDFMYFNAKQEVRVNVGVKVEGQEDSPGLKKGGVLQLLRSEVELVCRADAIPSHITISMAGTDIGDAVHMSSVELPDGVQPAIHDRDFTIASVVGTRTSTMADLEDGEEGGEAAEGEEGSAEGDAPAEEAKDE